MNDPEIDYKRRLKFARERQRRWRSRQSQEKLERLRKQNAARRAQQRKEESEEQRQARRAVSARAYRELYYKRKKTNTNVPIEEITLETDPLVVSTLIPEQPGPGWHNGIEKGLKTKENTKPAVSNMSELLEEQQLDPIKSELQNDASNEENVIRKPLPETSIINAITQLSVSFADVTQLVFSESSTSSGGPSKLDTKNSCETKIEGKRIVDITYLFKELQKINDHTAQNQCSLNSLRIISENANGLISELAVRCLDCETSFILSLTDPNEGSDINKATVSCATSDGLGYSGLKTILRGLSVPCMSEKKFQSINNELISSKHNVLFIKEETDDCVIQNREHCEFNFPLL